MHFDFYFPYSIYLNNKNSAMQWENGELYLINNRNSLWKNFFLSENSFIIVTTIRYAAKLGGLQPFVVLGHGDNCHSYERVLSVPFLWTAARLQRLPHEPTPQISASAIFLYSSWPLPFCHRFFFSIKNLFERLAKKDPLFLGQKVQVFLSKLNWTPLYRASRIGSCSFSLFNLKREVEERDNCEVRGERRERCRA